MTLNINLERFINDVRKKLTPDQTQILEKNSETISSIFFEAASTDGGDDANVLENTTSINYNFLITKAIIKIKSLCSVITQNQKDIVSKFDNLSKASSYQEVLDEKVDEILNGKESISLDELKNHSFLSKIMPDLNDSDMDKFDFIAELEKRRRKVTERELRLLLAAFDAVPKETSRSDGSRFLGYEVDGTFAAGGLNRVSKEELKEAFKSLMAKVERTAYFKKNEEIYSKYNEANGKITSENLKSLVDDLVTTTGIFDKFPEMKNAILKDLSIYEGKTWSECFEDLKNTLVSSINVSIIAAAYDAESKDESNKTIDKSNYGGKDVDKKFEKIKLNLNVI